MDRQDFVKKMNEQVILLDGAMGTRLYDLGIDFDQCFDALSLEKPELVKQVHREYLGTGIQVIETNTFGANRVRLRQWNLEDKAYEIARAGARIAREAVEEANSRVWVAGSVGPLGKPLAPIGRITEEEAREAFAETIRGLLDGEVDLIILETFIQADEARIALEEVRKQTQTMPVVALMSFTDEGKTVFGNKPEEIVRLLSSKGADVVGANCSVGPHKLRDVMQRMLRVPGVPIACMPNAGLPELVGGRYMYLSSPEYMAKSLREFVSWGVGVIGGCCGTSAKHMEAIAREVRGVIPTPYDSRNNQDIQSLEPEPTQPPAEVRESGFREKLKKGEFVVSVEIDPPKGIDATKLVAGAATCKANGVDAINIADSPLARARMSPMALAMLIRKSVDIDVILHMSCRDRNVLGLQSECMGAQALGIQDILCVTGDPPQMGDYPDATGVFDVNSVGLVALLDKLNRGVDLAGKPTPYKTNFHLGVASNPTALNFEEESQRYQEKLAVGAEFTMTQPLYAKSDLERWMDENGTAIPLLVGILPLRNGRHAEFLHNEVPGMSIPKEIRDRMHKAGDQGAEEGVMIAQEFLLSVREMVQGVYLMPPFNRFEMAVDVTKVLGDR